MAGDIGPKVFPYISAGILIICGIGLLATGGKKAEKASYTPKELGRLDTIGKPIVFGTTEEFLRCFGVSSIEELPDIDEVTKQSFMEEAMEEVAESLNVPV